MIEDFHLLRPWWLLGLVAAAALAVALARRGDPRTRWRSVIAPHLLDHLVVGRGRRHRIRPAHLTVAMIALGSIAAAGPTFQRERAPFVTDTAPLAIAVDLSSTMDSRDVTPSRLERAKLKLRDLLAARPGARTSLYAYAGTAHRVLPLTDDAALLTTYADALSTGIMPVPGKDTAALLALVDASLADEPSAGTIVLLTDGVEPGAGAALSARRRSGVVVLGIGADPAALRALRVAAATVTTDGSDVAWVVRQAAAHLAAVEASENDRWQDSGWWLVPPLVLMGALWFRRGWSVRWAAVMALVLLAREPASAGTWADLWLTRDQQGRRAFEAGDFPTAAALFADPMWRAVALYRAGRFAEAADTFALVGGPDAAFDRGNALARTGAFEDAAASFRHALELRPGFAAAQKNLGVMERLIALEDDGGEEAPDLPPDGTTVDEKGTKGDDVQVDAAQQSAEMWMRNIATTPAGLLARRFALEAAQ